MASRSGRREGGATHGSPGSNTPAASVAVGFRDGSHDMAHIGIGSRKSHYLWIILGAAVLIAVAYLWATVF